MEKGHLYIIRHGQTDWNVEHKLQGRTDIPLNENGRKMAVEAHEKYKDIKIDICYSSPLSRAYETAQTVLEGRNVQIIRDDRLMEMSFGKYEGLKGVLNMPEHSVYKLFNNPAGYVADEGAETLAELYARTGDFIQKVLLPEINAGKNVLIVGHGAMNLSIINQLMNIPVERFWENMQGNCELKEIDLECMGKRNEEIY